MRREESGLVRIARGNHDHLSNADQQHIVYLASRLHQGPEYELQWIYRNHEKREIRTMAGEALNYSGLRILLHELLRVPYELFNRSHF